MFQLFVMNNFQRTQPRNPVIYGFVPKVLFVTFEVLTLLSF